MKSRFGPLLALLKGLQPKAKLAVAGATLLVVALVFATCSACRRGSGGEGKSPAGSLVGAAPSASTKAAVKEAAANAGVDEPLLWQHARLGDAENLSNLAGYEGPVGLQEVAEKDPSLKPIAIKAMGYLHGWAQVPYLVKAAAGENADEAKLAEESILELATRPRTSVDPEDSAELEEGCKGLLVLAKDTGKSKPRRVNAVRALRMLPCPIKPEEVPSDVDAK
jgi:hypothetical protein